MWAQGFRLGGLGLSGFRVEGIGLTLSNQCALTKEMTVKQKYIPLLGKLDSFR